MSHADKITEMPQGFVRLAYTENSPYAAMAHKEKKIYALQFHPEVVHTEEGEKKYSVILYLKFVNAVPHGICILLLKNR